MVMHTRFRKKSYKGRLVVPALATAFFVYFGFHTINGDLGLNSKMKLEARRADLQHELDMLTAEREAMETKVRLLRDGTLEKDMLDERARALLEVSRKDEVVIYR